LFLRVERHYAAGSIAIALAALRAFYRDHLGTGRDWQLWRELKVRRNESWPTVLGREEVARLLAAVRVDRFRTVLQLINHGGLRIREACRLEVQDIKATLGVCACAMSNINGPNGPNGALSGHNSLVPFGAAFHRAALALSNGVCWKHTTHRSSKNWNVFCRL
jgi:hypothetical protein